jgi:5-methyltetrahydropteroyltriglutamate--homocysteine methyltransferase
MTAIAQLGGIYPRSEQLIELTRSFDRGKTDRTSLEKQFEADTKDLVILQEESGFKTISDGAFYWQDQLRPIVESLEGITTGTRYDRWFDTNTFYKKPTVAGKIRLGNFDPKKFIRIDLLPKSREWKVTILGPYSFAELSENLYYNDRSDLLSDLATAERDIISRLHAAGIARIQINEPCLVYRPYRERELGAGELNSAFNAIEKSVKGAPASIALHTFFGDATDTLPRLLQLPVDTVGVDLFETDYSHLNFQTTKKIALGIVDSRESNIEDPKWIAETATRASKHIVSENIVLAPNSDLKFVPRRVADSKARALANAARLVKEIR